ncbi:TPA: hypothetical protein ACH3X1_004631 [Trebouxia sp. C0004]
MNGSSSVRCRHNAQGIMGYTNLNILLFIKFMTSKRLPNSLTGNIIVRGAHHGVKISNDSLHHFCLAKVDSKLTLLAEVASVSNCFCSPDAVMDIRLISVE